MTYTAETTHTAAVNRARALAAQTVTCPHCGDTVAESRLSEHIEIKHKDVLLAQCEEIIDNGLKIFMQVGQALQTINEQRLYAPEYSTFEDYCERRWNISRQRGYQLITAAGITAKLSTNVDAELLPEHESHIRPLSGLPDEALIPVWTVIRDTAPGGKITAAHTKSVAAFAKQMIETGAIDDGTGNSVRVADVAKAAITEETYERWQRQKAHIEAHSKRQRVLSAEARQVRILESPMFTRVELQIPLTVDITELTAAIASGKPITVTLSTEKDAS